MFLQPIFARGGLQMANEINENHHHDGEDIGGSEGGDEEGEGSEQGRLQIDNDNPGEEVGVKGRLSNAANRFLHLLGAEAGRLAQGLADQHVLAHEKDEQE